MKKYRSWSTAKEKALWKRLKQKNVAHLFSYSSPERIKVSTSLFMRNSFDHRNWDKEFSTFDL